MELLLWATVFIVALAIMVVGADTFLKNAETIGLKVGMSAFTVGVIIVGFGTSLPEMVSGLIAIVEGAPSIVPANAIGSNIANILLIGGVLAFLGKRIKIDRDLLEAELPFFVISTALFAEIAFDAQVTFVEALLLVGTFIVYVFYLFKDEYEGGAVVEEAEKELKRERYSLFRMSEARTLLLLVVGLAGLLVGAKYVIDAVIVLAGMLSVPPSAISITAIALGTSLPELVVSVQAVKSAKFSVAVGNIFGSNAFNISLAVGIPGVFATLPLDTPTFAIGLPVLLVSSFILLVIGLAHRLHRWEGIMFFILYAFFLMQILTICCTT